MALMLESKLKDDNVYSLSAPKQALQRQLYVLQAALVRNKLVWRCCTKQAGHTSA